MASISKEPNGRRRILFIAPDGKRKTIRLGKISQRNAESFKVRVEQLVTAATLQTGIGRETALWVAQLDNPTHEKLARAGLVEPRENQDLTLQGHIDAYLKRRTEVKPRTVISWKQARESLLAYFGPKRKLSTITVADAKDWERWLATPPARGNLKDDETKTGLAINTIRKRVANAKLFFEDAVARELIPANPFKPLRGAVGTNRERDHFVTLETIEKVLDACPDAEWRLIVALSRFAGLRCPSEHLALTIDDVDWRNQRLRIPSAKTEHHAGKAYRVIPIFPQLKPYLEDVCEMLPAGKKFLINRYRSTNANLRTQ
ncbi:site-specific integrase, partial [Bremerella cremea]|uniref:tyrosine-type recombinase/integrase n=1 Tax=Bremerella cremea TaxID=1031537 RepID=UPI0031EF8818